jgi:molybdopterin molybdotransferase
MRTFISFTEALDCVLSHAVPTRVEEVPLSEAISRTLAQPITARDDLPPFASSAMDGFAVRTTDFSDDPHRPVQVVDHVAAGDARSLSVQPGTCVEIMTGAPFPRGADAVIPIEWVLERDGDRVRFERIPNAFKHVRPAAEDIQSGTEVFTGGERITPAIAGMLASLGVAPVPVRVRPRVRVISTGDEIVPASSDIGPGQIRNSNGPSLRAQVLEAGGSCDHFEHVPDDPEAIRAMLADENSADLLLFSGGVSVGQHDHVKQVLDAMGAETLFWKVKQRPGKPLAFGRLGSTLFLGLPGNPVSSAMCFEIYGRPVIEAMLGRTTPRTPLLSARLGRSIKKVDGLHFFTRGIARVNESGQLSVVDTGPQGSNLYGSVVMANCIVHLREAGDYVAAGTVVQVQMLPWSGLDEISSPA